MARPELVVHLRVQTCAFMATCDVCGEWWHFKLPWNEVDEIDLKCRTCGGTCEPHLETLVCEFTIN